MVRDLSTTNQYVVDRLPIPQGLPYHQWAIANQVLNEPRSNLLRLTRLEPSATIDLPGMFPFEEHSRF